MGFSMYVKPEKKVCFFFNDFFYLDNNIIQIPLTIVIIGCLASAFLLIVLLIILNDRTRGENINFCKIKKYKFFSLFSTTIYVSDDFNIFNNNCGIFFNAWINFMHCILYRIYNTCTDKS